MGRDCVLSGVAALWRIPWDEQAVRRDLGWDDERDQDDGLLVPPITAQVLMTLLYVHLSLSVHLLAAVVIHDLQGPGLHSYQGDSRVLVPAAAAAGLEYKTIQYNVGAADLSLHHHAAVAGV